MGIDHRGWRIHAYLDDHFTVSIMDRRATSGDPLSPLEMKREFEDVAAVPDRWMETSP